jgi:hypothetical protein
LRNRPARGLQRLLPKEDLQLARGYTERRSDAARRKLAALDERVDGRQEAHELAHGRRDLLVSMVHGVERPAGLETVDAELHEAMRLEGSQVGSPVAR